MNQRLRAVSRLWLLLAAFLFAQSAWAQVSLITINSPYSQDFNTLSNTAGSTTNTALPTGFFLTETGGGARDNEQYAVDTGSSTTGDTYSYGSTAATDRAFGGLRSGTLIPVIGAAFTNNTGTTITSLSITYTGEEWRLGTASRADRLDFQYSTNATDPATGTYVDVDALDFSTPSQTTIGAKDGNATGNRTLITSTITSLSIAPGATFWIRFNDLDASGADDGLAIDDFSITPMASTPVASLSANPTTLTDFVATQGSVSPAKSYTLTGSNLDGNPVSVSATANIELSTTMGGTYTPTLSIPATTSAVSQEIFARLTTTAPTGPFSGTITNTANTTLTAAVTVSGQVNAPNAPSLSASPTTLSGFSTPQGTVSSEQTYTLTAANLTAGISVSAPAGVEVSQTTGSGFMSSLTLPMATTSAVVYVRLTGAGAAGPVSGTITNVSGNLTANVAVSGTVSSTAPVSYTLISQIQGSGLTSPLTGTTQTIQGIVTRVFASTTGLTGFYVQEEDADSDNNPATSEGIFVFDNTNVFTGNPGDKVRITGAVTEFVTTVAGFPSSSLTEITLTSAANITVVSTGNPLPSIVNVQLPVANVSDLERYEGMLITMSAASGNLTVTEYFQLGRFGQVVLSATGATNQPGTDPRLDQYTQFFAPSVAGYTAYLAEIAKRRIYLDDGRTGQNPDPIIFGRGGQPLSASNTLRGGDQVASITAILDERSEGYRLQTNTGVNFQPTNPRSITPPVVGGTLKAGSFNVLNYFTDLGTGNFTTCAGNSIQVRGAENAIEFTRQRDKIIQAIVNSGVDVMGLNEMENNGFGANSAIQDLINGLNAVAGANSFTYINSGCISTDAITVAMIYKPAKVTPVGSSTAIPFNYGTGAFTVVGRRALAQTFQQNSDGAVFTLVANHWKSKGSSSGGAGDADAGDGQSASNGTRTRQAQDLVSWLNTKPTGTTDPDYLIVGDLNSYAKEDPLTTLEQGGYTNLVPNTTYSYVFDGFVGALDHALRSASLQTQVTGADKWHINSDEPSVLDYNTNFKTPGQITSLYSAEPYRASDHDPVIIGLTLTPAASPLALTLTANPTMLTTSGTTTLSATVSGGTTPYSYTFTGPGTISQSPTSNTASVSGIPAGVQTYTVVARDATAPTSQTISGTVSVTVLPANTAPVATSNANQTATVGVAFSYTVNAFTDDTPSSLTYSASIVPPNGFSFDPATRVISGTPSMSGVSSVTVTATDPGNLSASTSFSITVSPVPVTPPPTATFSITGVTTVSCETISAGQRRVTFNPRYVGLDGTPVSFSVVNELAPTTNPGPYVLRLYTDNPVITLQAVQSGASTSFAYNWLSACSSSTANTPPMVANPVSPQSATVGLGYTLSLANVFTDAETPSGLSLSVMGLPSGLNFVAPSTISGTPSMSGVSSVTVTATDPGSLSASTTFTITISPAGATPPPPSGTFSITSVTTISCEVLSAGQRRLTFNPQYVGLNGAPVSFSVVNELAPTTNPGPYVLNLYTDNPVITLQAVQSGISSSFAYNWLSACSSSTANTAPTVVNPVAPQSATVGVGYTLSLSNVFTDAETPNQLTLSVVGLPVGLSFTAPSTISGTPSMSGVNSVTVTATDPGSLSATTTFTLTVSPAAGTPPPTGTFSITGVTTVSCEMISAGERRLTFSPRYAGLDGSPVSFSVANELAATTNPGPYTLRLYTDNPVITLRAIQSGVTSSFAYNWLSACNGGARVSAEPGTGLQVRVLGNPVHEVLDVAVTGAEGGALHLVLTDGQGRVVGQRDVKQTTASERVHFNVSHQPAGVLILRATTTTQSQTVKVIKAE